MRLEAYFQPKLHLPAADPRAGHLAESGARGRCAGPAKLRRVGHIERFRPELDLQRFPHDEVFQYTDVSAMDTVLA